MRKSSVSAARLIDNPIGCPAIICGSCAPSRSAEPRPWAATGINATTAVIWKYRITPAETGTAPKARPYGKSNGSRLAVRTSCPMNKGDLVKAWGKFISTKKEAEAVC